MPEALICAGLCLGSFPALLAVVWASGFEPDDSRWHWTQSPVLRWWGLRVLRIRPERDKRSKT